MVEVTDGTSLVSVPATVSCTLGGSSVPMTAMAMASPFTDLTVTLAKKTYDSAAGETDPSLGLTPTTGMDTVAFSTSLEFGFLSVDCAATIADSAKLTYTLSGTDMSAFALSTAEVTVTGVEASA